eukprot:gnl/Dysnectes_brevis/4818_a6660_810.p1 GENE.gnl/Dysnectes_brevis/4818_a6660_810~~gnl/Dysnectes_brevis/4818_a6660_810.p1  ORF type:complete len:466 (-),score=67.44 gnl/Dysnectes_brevis/4818_a6660_810:30-1427(-)
MNPDKEYVVFTCKIPQTKSSTRLISLAYPGFVRNLDKAAATFGGEAAIMCMLMGISKELALYHTVPQGGVDQDLVPFERPSHGIIRDIGAENTFLVTCKKVRQRVRHPDGSISTRVVWKPIIHGQVHQQISFGRVDVQYIPRDGELSILPNSLQGVRFPDRRQLGLFAERSGSKVPTRSAKGLKPRSAEWRISPEKDIPAAPDDPVDGCALCAAVWCLLHVCPSWTTPGLLRAIDAGKQGRIVLHRTDDDHLPRIDWPAVRACSKSRFRVALYHCAYQFTSGCFRKRWIRRGYDPRVSPWSGRYLQLVDYRLRKGNITELRAALESEHRTSFDFLPQPLRAQADLLLAVRHEEQRVTLGRQTVIELGRIALAEAKSLLLGEPKKDTESKGWLDTAAITRVRDSVRTNVNDLLGQVRQVLSDTSTTIHSPIRVLEEEDDTWAMQPLWEALDKDGVPYIKWTIVNDQ